jgi:hypothetical protein
MGYRKKFVVEPGAKVDSSINEIFSAGEVRGDQLLI